MHLLPRRFHPFLSDPSDKATFCGWSGADCVKKTTSIPLIQATAL